jgi:hypothetical protein
MADIFISYANEDRDVAAQLARLIESAGWRVWWDRRIPAGRTWRSVLEDALRDMRCMVVLWSEKSVESPWVAEEAEEARRLGKSIVPVLIQHVEPPIGFRAIQAADLAKWDGSADDPAALQFLGDLKSVLGGETVKPPRLDKDDGEVRPVAERSSHAAGHQRPKVVFAGVAAVAIIAVLTAWQLWPDFRQPNPEPTTEERSQKPPTPSLISLVIDGARKEIKASETVRLALRGKYSDGTQTEVKEGIEWSSSAPEVAAVGEDGEVKGLKAGSSDIKAKIGGIVSAGWTVSVKPREPEIKPVPVVKLIALRISASHRELFIKDKVSLRVRGRYSDNSEQNLASGIEWQVSDPLLASVNRGGELQGLRSGKVEIVARAGELRSPAILVYIKEAPKVAAPPMKPAILGEQAKARIAAYIRRAEFYRGEGNYAAALAELEKAKAIDALNDDIRKATDQTRRACNAERVLGNKPDC